MAKKEKQVSAEVKVESLTENSPDFSPKVTRPAEEKKSEDLPDTMKIASEREIAMDFATKIYKKFNETIKSIVLFGSSAKKSSTPNSDIDIIIIIDDVAIKWDLELIAWYREELGKVIGGNPYIKSLHINTVKLSTWWQDLIRGDPVVINVVRYGDALIDFGGFFSPLKILLQEGKIRSTPEAIYTLLQRAPTHMARTRASMLAAIDGLYWAYVDSAHAALIAANVMPPSPEHIFQSLKDNFVDKGMLKMKYAESYRDLHLLAKDIIHGKIAEIKGNDIDEWFGKSDDFLKEMASIVDKLV